MQAVNSETKTFADGLVNGTYSEEYDPDFRDALAKGVLSALYLDGALPFRVEGTATFRDGEMLSFDAESIGQIEFPEGPGTFESAISRVKVLLALDAGWLDGDGEVISQDEAEFMLGVMAALADLEAPCPLLFPTEAGHVRAEWLTNGHEVIWECDLAGEHFVLVRALGQADGVEHSIPVNLSTYDVAETIVNLGVFKSYRAAQERQRIAEVRRQVAEEYVESTTRWAHKAFDEQARLSERCGFLRGQALARGATDDDLRATP